MRLISKQFSTLSSFPLTPSCEAADARGPGVGRADGGLFRQPHVRQPVRVALHGEGAQGHGLRGGNLSREDRAADRVPHEAAKHHISDGKCFV